MSYPNWFDPTPWDDTKAAEFIPRVLEDIDEQTPETQAAWADIAQKMVEAADLFKAMVDGHVGIVHVTMQANNELDEYEMYLNFRLYQRTYGASGPVTGPDNWAAINVKLDEIEAIFSGMVAGEGETKSSRELITTPGSWKVKLGLAQKSTEEEE
jgi:hypothetical protein